MEKVVLAIYFVGDLEGESSFEGHFFFTWTAANRKILTLDNLKSRNISIFNKCCMCKSDGESVCHLLLHCSYAYNLWTFIFSLFLCLIGSLNCWLVGMEVFGVILQLLSGGLSFIVLCGLYGGSRTIGFLKERSSLS